MYSRPKALIIAVIIVVTFFNLGQNLPVSRAEDDTTAQSILLQQQLNEINQEIAQYQAQLKQTTSQKKTLQNKINQLKIEQAKLAAQIKQTNLIIQGINGQLSVVQNDIEARQNQIATLAEQIVGLLRQVEKKDHWSPLVIMISQQGLGGFFQDLADYKKLTNSLSELAGELAAQNNLLKQDQDKLSSQRETQQNLLAISNLQSDQLGATISERNTILNQTKAQESAYQQQLADRQARANQIKSRLYELLGISQAVTFGEAVKVANWASGLSGVRAAFLLAILTQESNLGKNVGTCNRPGDPPEKSWKVIMKPERDQKPFVTITSELKMNPDITPVSCPMKDAKGNQIGWGGAMGPAQFIPSTWLGYRAQVTAVTGKSVANPWDIRDAFAAAALKLKADGASSQSGEWAAAMKYFSGSTNTAYRFYGDNVVAIADKYQQDIDDLNAK